MTDPAEIDPFAGPVDDWCLECEHAPHGVGPRACKTCGCGAQRCEQCGVRKSYDGLAWACAEGCPDA
jgi:hypothetical protein